MCISGCLAKSRQKPLVDVDKLVADGSSYASGHLLETIEVHPIGPRPEAVVSVRLEGLVQVLVTVDIAALQRVQMELYAQLLGLRQTAVFHSRG